MKTSRSIKWLLALFIIILIHPLTHAQVNTPATATVPFGSKIAASASPYAYGIVPTNLPTGAYTPASNLYGKSQDAYNAYNTWKSTYVQACGSQYRVLFDDGSSTVSEGIGYGMLLAAYAADKALFDGLWAYYKANSNGNGLMNWKMSGCTGTAGSNGATDADLDAAMALIVASKQWPSSTSPYTYSTEATTLITAIKTYEIHNTSYQAINGDGWGMGSTCRNPSYQAPAYYRQFATQVSSQATTWNNAVTAAYTLLNANRNTTTGLVSNWSDPSGAPNSCNGSNEYGYDACRNPWRMAVDVLWTGNSTAQTNFCVPIASYVNGKGASGAGGPVAQSGGSGTVNATFVSTYAAGICGATSTYQTIMNSMYTKTVGTVDASGYFGNTLRVISLFVQTGNFWNPSTLAASPVTATLTSPGAGNYNEGSTVTLTATATTTTGTISKVEFYDGATLIGTATSSPYSISWIINNSGSRSITAIAYNSSSQTGTSSPVILNVYKAINQTSTAPAIDGTVDAIWSSNNAGSLNNIISGTITNAADLSGTFKALWDNTYIYLLVDVTDNTLINDSGTNKYDDDNIEVFFDIGNTKATTVGSNYFQYMFRWNDATVTEANSKSTTGITFAHVTKTGGYITEIRIPWSTVSNTPAVNQLVGFDVEVDDDDDGGTRDGKMSWYASADQAWTNPSYAGTAVLLGSSCTLPSAAGSITGSTSVCAGTTGATYSITAVSNATGYTWTVPAGASITAGSGTNSITVTMGTTSGTISVTPTNSCGNGTSASISVTVNATVTPSVTASSSATTICAGTSITLTAAPTNGGTAPTYQWKKGGTAISGATNATYTTTTAANNDSYTVTMTSNATCPSTPTATSAAVVITVNAVVTPSVTASSSATTICAGTSITLTAAPTNGGTAPTYQWKKGGTAISGATNATYTTTTAANNDSYTVTMTSNATCPSPATATSTAVVITVNAVVTPSVTASSSATTIFSVTIINLTVSPSNCGSDPNYQWKKGGTAISGATNATYTTTTA
ncbi:glycosyl hydrolase family 8, partial [Cytophaga sp.]|uniref:glycosyl hydrolase family 8 n=1 Tax=Cytophaga sp. TaxID=29535 RepID=UPI003F81E517